MEQRCANCDTMIPAMARFCPSCGSRAPEPPAGGGPPPPGPSSTMPSGVPSPPLPDDAGATMARAAPPPPPPPPPRDPFASPPAGAASRPEPTAPAGPSLLRQTWDRIGSRDLAITGGIAALALVFAVVGLILATATDSGSKGQIRSTSWQQVAVVLSVGAVVWAALARTTLPSGPLLPGRGDRLALWALAGGSLVFIAVGFIRTAGYEVDESNFDERAWLSFALTWAFLAMAWSVLTRQLEPASARRNALIMTSIAGFFCIGALAIGHTGEQEFETVESFVRASAWYGVALVLAVLAAAAMFGQRPAP